MIFTEINYEEILIHIINILLYTEIHYRFNLTGSRYYKNEPEILSDAPIRLEPDKDLPILLLVKDSHKYPITLFFIEIFIYDTDNVNILKYKKIEYNKKLCEYWWYKHIFINVSDITGNIDIDIVFNYEVNNKNKKCYNHNYPYCTNKKLSTYISKFKYPNDGMVDYGDLHYHTNLTEDMVEFGAPIDSTLHMAEAMGLDFFCTTDHSYDLDDKIGSWTETDPKLEKWHNSRKLIKSLNNDNNFKSYILPSEELSLHNTKNQNIHALIINNSKFLPGAGDGAEKPFVFKSEFNTKNIYQVLDKDSLCIAAHPFSNVPLAQKIFFKRGKWNRNDITIKNLNGLQILNGALDDIFYKSINIWISLLLKGYKIFIYAGNDAHGNFNLYRQIHIPMISIKEKKEQLFGNFRTGVIVTNKNKDTRNTIKQLANGNCFITNGPFLNINIISENMKYEMGSTINAKCAKINIKIISNKEFGIINNIYLFKGVIDSNKEIIQLQIQYIDEYVFDKNFNINTNKNCYYRCMVNFKNNESLNNKIIAYSNPIWINNI